MSELYYNILIPGILVALIWLLASRSDYKRKYKEYMERYAILTGWITDEGIFEMVSDAKVKKLNQRLLEMDIRRKSD